MKTRQEYIDLLRKHSTEIQDRFGITYMRMFGSVARDEHHDGSDVDVFVDMPPKAYDICAANEYLEQLLGCPVDLIRRHAHLRPFLLEQIMKYGIDIY